MTITLSYNVSLLLPQSFLFSSANRHHHLPLLPNVPIKNRFQNIIPFKENILLLAKHQYFLLVTLSDIKTFKLKQALSIYSGKKQPLHSLNHSCFFQCSFLYYIMETHTKHTLAEEFSLGNLA